jgi:hypothetical protein
MQGGDAQALRAWRQERARMEGVVGTLQAGTVAAPEITSQPTAQAVASENEKNEGTD